MTPEDKKIEIAQNAVNASVVKCMATHLKYDAEVLAQLKRWARDYTNYPTYTKLWGMDDETEVVWVVHMERETPPGR